MKNRFFAVLGACFIGMSMLFPGCSFSALGKTEVTFNLSCTPKDSENMEVYFAAYSEDGKILGDTSLEGKITDKRLTFSKKVSDSAAYVYFFLVKKGYSRPAYYGSMDLDSPKTTYNFIGYWFYNHYESNLTDTCNYQMVGMHENYFVDVEFPVHESYFYNSDKGETDIFHAYKINTKENGCIKFSYSDCENTDIYINKDVDYLLGKQLYSMHNIADNIANSKANSFVFCTDGTPIYVLIRPTHYFNKNEASSVSYAIEDMEAKLPDAANIHTVCSYANDGFYFLKVLDTKGSSKKADNSLCYHEYSTGKLSVVKEFDDSIVKAEFDKEKAFIAYGKSISCLDLTTKTASVVWTAEEIINDILLIDNNSKLVIADVKGNLKVYDVNDFTNPLYAGNRDLYPISHESYDLVYIPQSRRLVWDEYSIYTGTFSSDFLTFNKNSHGVLNQNNGKIRQYRDEDKIITSYGHVYDCTSEESYTNPKEITLGNTLKDVAFFDTYWVTVNNYSLFQKRSYSDLNEILFETRLKFPEDVVAVTKDSKGNLIVVTQGEYLSNDQKEIFVHTLDSNLKEITNKSRAAVKPNLSSSKMSFSDIVLN